MHGYTLLTPDADPVATAHQLLRTNSPAEILDLLHRAAFHGSGGDWRKARWTRNLNVIGRIALAAPHATETRGCQA